MSERYTRLFSLPNNLYLDGAPLIIAAGALLKDSRSGEVLVQLKLQNLHHAVLTSCKVHVRAFDPSGAELEGVDSFSYLDLQVSRGKDFGAKTPIGLPDSTTRRVSVCVIQAVFDDGDVWQNPVCEWTQPEVRAQLLSDKLGSDELVKQYELEVGENCKYVPETVGSLSLCTCGAINLAGEKVCSQCHRELKTLAAAMDVPALTKKMKERLAAEEAARIERERQEQERLAAEAIRRKRNKKLAIITASSAAVIAAVIAAVVVVTQVIIPSNRYKAAEEMFAAEDYDGAIAAFTELGDYKDSVKRIEEAAAAKEEAALAAKYEEAVALEENGELGKAAIAFGKLGSYSNAHDRSLDLWDRVANRSTVATNPNNTCAIKYDGSVILAGIGAEFERGYDVSEWTNIVDIAHGGVHIVGLRSDGTVVATKGDVEDSDFGQCDVSKWADIVAVDAGNWHTVGLRLDGTVVATGDNEAGQSDVSGWTDIISVATDAFHTVGLKSDGTVVAVGDNYFGQCDVSEWTDIVAIAAGGEHTVGLKSDGTVVATGDNDYGQCDVSEWKNVVAVTASIFRTVALRADGTVAAAGYSEYHNVSEWTGIKMPNR